MKRALAASLLLVAQCYLFGGNAHGASDAVDIFLQPLYSHADTFKHQLDSVKLSLGSLCGAVRGCSRAGPLGMEDGRIPDDSIEASSVHNNPNVNHGPQRGRLNTEGLPAAWCPQTPATGYWIQVNLGAKVYVTGLITQGRGSGDGFQQWVERFKVLYSDDGQSWTYVTGADGLPIEFAGNSDQDTQIVTQFPNVLHTRFVRIVTAACTHHCCMRFEVLGCRPSE